MNELTSSLLPQDHVDWFCEVAVKRMMTASDIKIKIPKAYLVEMEKKLIEMFSEDSTLEEPIHIFAPGLYNRNLVIKAGDIVVGKVHKEQHLTTLLAGTASILTESGVVTYVGPASFISEPLAKRAVYAHTDCLFATYHVTTDQDVASIEDRIIMKTDDYTKLAVTELEQLKLADIKQELKSIELVETLGEVA